MLVEFFLSLRAAGVPASLREYLDLLGALRAGVGGYDVENFYYLCRTCLVKDERHLDRFDKVFGQCFRGAMATGVEAQALPEEWLRRLAEKFLTPEEMAQIKALGGFDALMDALRERLATQKERHQGGNKWIGTAGTSPFGAYGYNPEGVRVGQHESRHRQAVKVWDRREFRNLDDSVELGTRNIKLALRRLRKFAHEGAATELDLPGTIRATAKNAGYLDLHLLPERHNTIKVLLLLDVGGSMDDHVAACAELFSAARSEFKHLEAYYFHNCVYEAVWRDNRRRPAPHPAAVRGGAPLPEGVMDTMQLLRTYPPDWKLILVGDAAMSPYELVQPGGSVEHWNEEPGRVWLGRLLSTYAHAAWLNPLPEEAWGAYRSVGMVQEIVEGRMYPLTLLGLDRAMAALNH